MQRALRISTLLGVLLAFTACGPKTSDDNTNPDNLPADASTSTPADAAANPDSDASTSIPADASTSVDPDGGSQQNSDAGSTTNVVGNGGGTVTSNGVTLVFPAGALASDTTITVSTVTGVTPPAGVSAISPFFKFGPDGTLFGKTVTVTLPVSNPPANAQIYWSKIGGTGFDALNTRAGTGGLSADVGHFSIGFVGTTSTSSTCSPQEQFAQLVAMTAPPVASPELVQLGDLVFTASGVWALGPPNTSNSSLGTRSLWFSSDGKSFNPVPAGILDVANDAALSLVQSSNDVDVVKRQGTACGQKLSTFTNVYAAQTVLLGVLPDGTIAAVVYPRTGNSAFESSTDGGKTWTVGGNQKGDVFAFAPSNPKQLHIGRGYNSSLASIGTSTDGGATWTNVAIPSGTILTGTGWVVSIAVDPGDANTVYAVTTGSYAGLYKSTDGGKTFPQSGKVTVSGIPVKVAFTADRKLWVASNNGATNNPGGLFEKDNGATTFTALNTGLTGADLPVYGFGFKTGEIWRLGNAVRKSTDGGQTWTVVPVAGLGTLSTTTQLTSPTDEKTFVAAGGQYYGRTWYRTTDGGATFTQLTFPFGPPTAVAVTGTGTLIANGMGSGTTATGIRSTDGGKTWTDMTGLGGYNTQASGIDGAYLVHRTGSKAYLLDDMSDLWRTDDDGATWAKVASLAVSAGGGSSYGANVIIDPKTSGRLFAIQGSQGTAGGQKLSVSSDGGATWTEIMAPTGVTLNLNPVPVTDYDGRLWLVGYDSSFKSKLYAVEPGATTLTEKTLPSGAFATTPTVLGNTVFVRTVKSTDGGATWTQVDLTKPTLESYLGASLANAPPYTRANPKHLLVNFDQTSLRNAYLP